MGYWTKSRLIFNSFREHAQASIRQVARQTGLSKSSVHRLGQAMARRNQHPESWFWESEEGLFCIKPRICSAPHIRGDVEFRNMWCK